MKKMDWKEPMAVIAAFLLGIIIHLAAGKVLAGVLPASMAGARDLITVLLQVLIPGAVLFAIIRIFHKED